MTPVAAQVFSCSVRPRRRAGAKREPMTDGQKAVRDFIELWIAETGQAPLRREIAAGLCLSVGRVSWVVLVLAENGWIRVTYSTPRGIDLV